MIDTNFVMINGELENALAKSIKQEIDIYKTFPSIHIVAMRAVSEYLESNFVLLGAYSGMVSGSPDPLNGVKRIPFRNAYISGNTVAQGASQGKMSGYKNAIQSQLSLIVSETQDLNMTITIPPITIMNLSFQYSPASSYVENINILAKEIIMSLLGAVYSSPVAATSSSGGVGQMVIMGVE